MKLFRLFLFLPVVAVLVAGCGGGAAKLAAGDVAVVGGIHITRAQFDRAVAHQKFTLKSQGQTVPKAGSTEYASFQAGVVNGLVQNAELESEAQKFGLKVTGKDVQTQLDAIKKQNFGGSEKKYRQELAKQGYTDAEVRDQIRLQLIESRLFDKVTSSVKASDQQVHAYYILHQSQYQPSRDVRYILVGKNKATLAKSLESQLKGAKDATWCKLAKQYSQDPSSKNSCGKATFTEGQTVPEFNKLLFSLKTNEVASTNSAQYGWFVLQPTASVHTQTEKDVAPTIRAQLEQQSRNDAMSKWLTNMKKSYCSGSNIRYQGGFQPSPDPCAELAAATSIAPTTT